MFLIVVGPLPPVAASPRWASAQLGDGRCTRRLGASEAGKAEPCPNSFFSRTAAHDAATSAGEAQVNGSPDEGAISVVEALHAAAHNARYLRRRHRAPGLPASSATPLPARPPFPRISVSLSKIGASPPTAAMPVNALFSFPTVKRLQQIALFRDDPVRRAAGVFWPGCRRGPGTPNGKAVRPRGHRRPGHLPAARAAPGL